MTGTTRPVSARRQRSPEGPGAPAITQTAVDHALRLINNVCCFAGSADLIGSLDQPSEAAVDNGVVDQNDPAALYDWLVQAFSYQGVSDQIAAEYMDRHGTPAWADLCQALDSNPSCPKLGSFWQFHGCRYDKTSRCCSEPEHIDGCPLPKHRLRNGRLNQLAYSLFLFIRDVADGDLVGWIDRQIATAQANGQPSPDQLQQAIIGPLRNIYGVSDKVLSMALSALLLDRSKPAAQGIGADLIAVDTLVHNFLHRTGILGRFQANHGYGPDCYRPGGCADIIRLVANRIDARQFNPDFPAMFPRFVQHAIWQYCSQDGLNICNGNQVDDRHGCQNRYCRLHGICDRIALKT